MTVCFKPLVGFCFFLVTSACLSTPPALAQIASPPTHAAYHLVEAEANPQGPVEGDDLALDGKFVRKTGDYQPVFTTPVPADLGDNLTVWVRYRGQSLQLKSIAEGKQTEFNWLWGKPDEWTWASFGRFERAKLGQSILVIRTPGEAAAEVDAVVFEGDEKFSPEVAIPLPQPQPLPIRVDWNKPLFSTTPLSFGLNLFQGFNPQVVADPHYQANLAYMKPGIVRYHNWGILGDSAKDANGWLDYQKRDWDAAKVKSALGAWSPPNVARLINIPGWPQWMDADKDGYLDADQFDAFAALCASLVKIANADGTRSKTYCQYWEITNEQDGRYGLDLTSKGQPHRMVELGRIFNTCARAMKQVDASIRCGGPAVARPDQLNLERPFVQTTRDSLDFFSYHAYASGSASDSDRHIYDWAHGMGEFAQSIVAMLREEVPNRQIPAHFNEYNISWSWEIRDPRMTNNKGAVFDALCATAAVSAGATATCAWNEKDGIYGKTSPDDELRPGAQVYHLLNSYFIGQVVATTSGNPDRCVAFAVRDEKSRHYALMLINRTGYTQGVQGSFTPPKSKALMRDEISAGGFTSVQLESKNLAQGLVLPPHSVTVLRW